MKRKFLYIFLVILSVVCLAVDISACDSESGGQSGSSTNTEQSQTDSTDSHVHVYTRIPAVDATCESTGNIEYWYCYGCGKYSADSSGNTEITQADTVIPKLAHTESEAVIENEIEAICTKTGSYDTVVYCSVCEAELSRETITIPVIPHTESEAVIENEVEATCTQTGSYDSVVYCSVCNAEVSRETITIPLISHTESEAVTENYNAATCTKTGSYDSVVYCSVCNAEVSRETITIPVIPHTESEAVIENEIEATCTKTGSYDTVIYCSVCNAEVSRETITIPLIPHTGSEAVIENEVAATCIKTGSYDSVVYCSVCNQVISKETIEIPLIPHTESEAFIENEIAATCTKTGSYDSVVYCSECNTVLSRQTTTIPMIDHTEVVDEYVYPTFNTTGLTEGSHCSACGTVIVAQQTIAAYGYELFAKTDYEENSYVYSYSISVAADYSFVMYVLAAGNSYALNIKYGEISLVSNNIYKLTYADSYAAEYIAINSSGFAFVNSDGTDSGKTEIEKESWTAAKEITATAGNSTYGYYALANDTSGLEMQRLYYTLYQVSEGFANYQSDITATDSQYIIYKINLSDYSLTAEQVVSVWKVFYIENSMYYWLSNTLTITGNIMAFCIDSEYSSYTDRAQYDSDITAMLTEANALINEDMTELDIAMTLHDYVIGKIDYAYQSDGTTPETAIWAHNITGVSSKGYGVCEAYAKTYLALCLMNGLDCVIVSGYASGESHAWNLVKIDGVWYGVDCTWDDTGTSDISYTCFGMSANTIASSRTADTSSNYGIDYLYGLPEVTEYGIQLVTLYQGETDLGMYVNVDAAFAAMTDPSADYTVELYTYDYTGVLLLSAPTVLHYIYSEYSPVVNSITIKGILTDRGGGYVSVTPLYIINNFVLNCNFEVENIILSLADLDLSEYTLTTSGYYCRLLGYIYDNKTTNIISIKDNTSYETEIYAKLDISYYYGYALIRSKSYIGIYYGIKSLKIYEGDLTVDNYIAPAGLSAYFIELEQGGLLCINSLNYESVNSSNIYVTITLRFGSLETYPTLYLDDVNTYVNIDVVGSVSYFLTDMEGNVIDSWTETADPYNLDCAIATLGSADDFANISISFSGGTDKKTALFGVNENNEIVFNVELVDDYYYIKDGVLLAYSGDATIINIPDKVTVIGDSAFYNCTTLITVTLPDGITSIGDYAFCYCMNLTSINIPESVISIGDGAFMGCNKLIEIYNLSSIELTKGSYENGYIAYYALNIYTSTSGESNFFTKDEFVFYNDNESIYLVSYMGSETELTLPTLTDDDGNIINYSIYKYAFNNNKLYTSIIIPEGVTSIGSNAFIGCSALTSITISNSVTSIDSYAFASCVSLSSVVIPNNVSIIGYGAFFGCNLLVSITIPDSVNFIGSYAFLDCNLLKAVTFENNSGWYLTTTEGETIETDVDVTDINENATYLTSTYYNYYWYRIDS